MIVIKSARSTCCCIKVSALEGGAQAPLHLPAKVMKLVLDTGPGGGEVVWLLFAEYIFTLRSSPQPVRKDQEKLECSES